MTMRSDPQSEVLEQMAAQQHKDGLELIRAHIQEKSTYRNLSRCLNQMRLDEAADHSTTTRNEPDLRRAEEVEKEQLLAIEMEELKRNEINDKKYRQLLRQNSYELRALESKLRAAYVNKELKAQIAEKEAYKLRDKLQENQAYKLLRSAQMSDAEYRHKTIQQDILQKAKYRRELQDQMIAADENRRFEYEEFLREKKMMDDVIQRMHDEDVRAIEEKMCKMMKTQEEINEFKAAQIVWKEKKKQELDMEYKQIQDYLMSKASDAKAKAAEKKKIDDAKAKICEDIARKIFEERRQRKEREEMLIQLRDEEMKDELEQRHKREVDKEERAKIDTLHSLSRQMEERREEQRRQVQLDAEYRDQLIAKVAEDERVEQLSNEKKRRKMLEVKKFVEEMIVERRQKKVEDICLQKRLLEEQQKEEEKRQYMIREERVRMIEQHAKNLMGFFPPGLIEPEDLAFVNCDLADGAGKS